jgi:hypothetical protein
MCDVTFSRPDQYEIDAAFAQCQGISSVEEAIAVLGPPDCILDKSHSCDRGVLKGFRRLLAFRRPWQSLDLYLSEDDAGYLHWSVGGKTLIR